MRARADSILRISDSTFNDLNEWIEAAKMTGGNVRYGFEMLARLMALVNQGFAQELSRGPLDPGKVGTAYTGRHFVGYAAGANRPFVSGPRGTERASGSDPVPHFSQTAWKIPVRRITSAYYQGWKVKRLLPGVWALYNPSREAYFIEFGINHVGTTRVIRYKGGQTFLRSPRRVRRPIQKLSLMRTMKFVDSTDVYGKVWATMFGPFRPGHDPRKSSDLVGISQIQSYASGMARL